MWEEAKQAVENVYDRTTFEDLVDRESAALERCEGYTPMYVI